MTSSSSRTTPFAFGFLSSLALTILVNVWSQQNALQQIRIEQHERLMAAAAAASISVMIDHQHDVLQPDSTLDHPSSYQQVSLVSSSSSSSSKRTKPTFVLHVGLPKTGTTFLQETLCMHVQEEMLRQDNYRYLGTCPEGQLTQFVHHSKVVWDAFAETPHVTQDFLQAVERLEAGQNGIFVLELFSLLEAETIRHYADYLNPRFAVKILIHHRPIYEALPSLYNQRAKMAAVWQAWPGEKVTRGPWDAVTHPDGQEAIPYIPFDPMDLEGIVIGGILKWMHTLDMPQAGKVYQKYRHFFDDVVIIPMESLGEPQLPKSGVVVGKNKVDPLLHYMFCNAIKDAPNMCETIRQGVIPSSTSNPSVSFNYDMIAVAAYQAGLVTNKTLPRPWVAQQVQKRQEEELHLTSLDFNLDCIDDEALHQFEEFLLSLERNMMGMKWTDELESKYRAGFAKSKKKSFCWPNATQVLEDAGWQTFFQEL